MIENPADHMLFESQAYVLEYNTVCRNVDLCSVIKLNYFFLLFNLSLYFATTLTCIKNVGFRELSLKVSKSNLNFVDQI